MLHPYVNLLLITFLICFGIFLIVRTTGRKYVGLMLIFIACVDGFYTLCSMLTFSWIPVVRIFVSIILIILSLYFCIIELFIIKDAASNPKDAMDYIIVHGAKVYGTTPSPSLSDRLDATLLYLQKHQSCKAILTGTKWPYADISEAECMYQWLKECGIPEHRLILEDQAQNTLENLRFSFALINKLHPNEAIRIGLLTSDYHMHRTLYMARAEGFKSFAISVPTAHFFVKVNYFIREAFAMTEIYLFGVEGL